jgi:hypothetical protein
MVWGWESYIVLVKAVVSSCEGLAEVSMRIMLSSLLIVEHKSMLQTAGRRSGCGFITDHYSVRSSRYERRT